MRLPNYFLCCESFVLLLLVGQSGLLGTEHYIVSCVFVVCSLARALRDPQEQAKLNQRRISQKRSAFSVLSSTAQVCNGSCVKWQHGVPPLRIITANRLRVSNEKQMYISFCLEDPLCYKCGSAPLLGQEVEILKYLLKHPPPMCSCKCPHARE